MALLSRQKPQRHPRNRKDWEEQRPQEEPCAFGAPPLCRVFRSEAPGQKRHGDNGDRDEDDPGEHGRLLSMPGVETGQHPTEAVLLLSGWFWWLESRRGKPLVYVGGRFQLSDLLEQPVHLRTGFELGKLGFQLGFLGCNVFFERVGNRSATLHDTTSCLRVLTAGFALAILICRCPAVGSEVNTSNQATAIFKPAHRGRETGQGSNPEKNILRTWNKGGTRFLHAVES